MAFHPHRSHQPSYPLPPTHPTMVLTYALAVVALQRLSWPVTPPTVDVLPPNDGAPNRCIHQYIDVWMNKWSLPPTSAWTRRLYIHIKRFVHLLQRVGVIRPAYGAHHLHNHIYIIIRLRVVWSNTSSYGIQHHQLSITQQSTSIWKWYITRSGGSCNNISQKKAEIAHYYGKRWMRYPNTCYKRRKRG